MQKAPEVTGGRSWAVSAPAGFGTTEFSFYFGPEKCFIPRLCLGWRGIGVGFGSDALLACGGRGYSSGRRERAESEEKRELCFEKKPPRSCGGMPSVGVMPQLSIPGANRQVGAWGGQRRYPQGQGGSKSTGLGWILLVFPPPAANFAPIKGQKPFAVTAPQASPPQGAQPPRPREVPVAGRDATPRPRPHHGAPSRWHEPPVGLREILACCVPPVPAMHIL